MHSLVRHERKRRLPLCSTAPAALHSDEGPEMTSRGSPCPNPQIRIGMNGLRIYRCRCLPMGSHLHPQIHPNEQGAETSPAAGLPDDMLGEILLRLPPQPSSLPRASAVCKQWRRLLTDPRFLRRFSDHHRKPPLLGVFQRRYDNIVFTSVLDPPDRIPTLRLPWGFDQLLGCRHGRVLLMDLLQQKVVVFDPITGEKHHIDAPPAFRGLNVYGAVLCAAADQGHVHGNCHLSPFKVVLMSLCGGEYEHNTPPITCVYSSETGVWGNRISAMDQCQLRESNPGILVGNILYWSSKCVSLVLPFLDMEEFTDDIVEFDLDRQSLAVIKGPPCLNASLKHQIIQADNGDVGLAMLSHGRLEMWQRKVNCHGAATWLLQKTVEMHTVLGLPPQVEGWMRRMRRMRRMEILGYDEDKGAIFVYLGTNVYMVQLMSMQSRKLYESDHAYNCHPFTSFYAPGMSIAGSRHIG